MLLQKALKTILINWKNEGEEYISIKDAQDYGGYDYTENSPSTLFESYWISPRNIVSEINKLIYCDYNNDLFKTLLNDDADLNLHKKDPEIALENFKKSLKEFIDGLKKCALKLYFLKKYNLEIDDLKIDDLKIDDLEMDDLEMDDLEINDIKKLLRNVSNRPGDPVCGVIANFMAKLLLEKPGSNFIKFDADADWIDLSQIQARISEADGRKQAYLIRIQDSFLGHAYTIIKIFQPNGEEVVFMHQSDAGYFATRQLTLLEWIKHRGQDLMQMNRYTSYFNKVNNHEEIERDLIAELFDAENNPESIKIEALEQCNEENSLEYIETNYPARPKREIKFVFMEIDKEAALYNMEHIKKITSGS